MHIVAGFLMPTEASLEPIDISQPGGGEKEEQGFRLQLHSAKAFLGSVSTHQAPAASCTLQVIHRPPFPAWVSAAPLASVCLELIPCLAEKTLLWQTDPPNEYNFPLSLDSLGLFFTYFSLRKWKIIYSILLPFSSVLSSVDDCCHVFSECCTLVLPWSLMREEMDAHSASRCRTQGCFGKWSRACWLRQQAVAWPMLPFNWGTCRFQKSGGHGFRKFWGSPWAVSCAILCWLCESTRSW